MCRISTEENKDRFERMKNVSKALNVRAEDGLTE